MFGRLVAAIGIILVLVVGFTTYLVIGHQGSATQFAISAIETSLGQAPSADATPVHFVIAPGDSAATIGEKLASAGIIQNALAFRLVLRLDGSAGDLHAGDYELRRNEPLAEVVSILVQGRLSGGFLTVPEGWRALQISDALDRSQITSRDAFMQAVLHPTAKPAFLDQLPPSGSLEGYLFPDSYQFEPNTPADQVVQRMLDDFQRHLTPAMLSAYKAQGLSVDQAVIIASIVEREAETPSERPIIASVYLNRVHRGMKLQADPTVQYSLIPALGTPVAGTYWKGGLTLADLKNPSPYNTYVVGGLPPGPICNPGLASLEAVAKPATTDYLYFVARPDGTHAFAKTLEEQEQNVAKYQQ